MTALTWIVGGVLWLAVVGGILAMLWKVRYIVGWCLSVALAVFAVGFVVAVLWRSAEWWLGVIPMF